MEISRQVTRQIARARAKDLRSEGKRTARTLAKRALLEKQSRREKADFYGKRGVAQDIGPSRSRVTARLVQKGQAFGRIIKTVGKWALHATKGWRRA